MRKLIVAAAVILMAATIGGSANMAGSANLRDVNAAHIGAVAQTSILTRIKLLRPDYPNMSLPEELQHGVHLCSADSHCGTGHKCCSGHCKAVVTC